MENEILDPCVICGDSIAENAVTSFWLKGNNAQPLAEGQCCDICNEAVVVARITEALNREK